MACLLEVCIVAAQITHGGSYSTDLPSKAYAYDGEARDISHFYEVENFPLNVGGYILLDTDTKIDITYDTGVETDKFNIGQSVYLGLTQYAQLNKDWHMTYGGNVRLGGKSSHTPCYDGFDRAYYCGNLTAWEDFNQPEHDIPYNVSVKFTYKF